ncbi:hypothetical protein SC1_00199 [Sphingopyxis sp. C-1]|nr:hypothetical protein SC1_00199 [Sphingopyxis sp. C-1]
MEIVMDGEKGGMNMNFPGGKAGLRCGQVAVHGESLRLIERGM